MRSDLAELAFFVYFFSGFAFQRNKREQKMQKSITERTLRVMHDNASSEGTRLRRGGQPKVKAFFP